MLTLYFSASLFFLSLLSTSYTGKVLCFANARPSLSSLARPGMILDKPDVDYLVFRLKRPRLEEPLTLGRNRISVCIGPWGQEVRAMHGWRRRVQRIVLRYRGTTATSEQLFRVQLTGALWNERQAYRSSGSRRSRVLMSSKDERILRFSRNTMFVMDFR